MPSTKCGFDSSPSRSGQVLLVAYGPTLFVDIGFDPDHKPIVGGLPNVPKAGITQVKALVDTGASQSCIDSLLAMKLNLPIVDRQTVSGIGGTHEVNIHLAQIYVPTLSKTINGTFAGVHLTAGGQWHQALIGRTFLQNLVMVYDGRSGTVTLSY